MSGKEQDALRDEALAQPATSCDHRDERGSTVMQARDDKYECIVCGQRFRLMAVEALAEAIFENSVRENWASRRASGERP